MRASASHWRRCHKRLGQLSEWQNTKANTQTVGSGQRCVCRHRGLLQLNVTGQTAPHRCRHRQHRSVRKEQFDHRQPDHRRPAQQQRLQSQQHGADGQLERQGNRERYRCRRQTNRSATQPKMVTNPKTGVTSQAQSGLQRLQRRPALVMNAKGSTDSTNATGVSAGTVTITNEAAQLNATGQTATRKPLQA